MRKIFKNFLPIVFVISTFILPIKLYAAQDDLFKSLGKLGKELNKSVKSSASLNKSDSEKFIIENEIVFDDKRGQGVVTYMFTKDNYKRILNGKELSQGGWRFSKTGALRVFYGKEKLTWKIYSDKKRINISKGFGDKGTTFAIKYTNKILAEKKRNELIAKKKLDEKLKKEKAELEEKLKKEKAELEEKLKKEKAEKEKIEKELNIQKNAKLAELSNLEKNNKTNVDLAKQINDLLYKLPKKNNKEVQDILLDYNNNISKLKASIQKAQSKSEIDKIIIDPGITKNLDTFVINNKEKITSLENEYKVFKEEENKRIALEEERRKKEEERIRVENEKKEAERIRLAEIEEQKYLKTYAGQIDGWEDLKFGEIRSSIEGKIRNKGCKIEEYKINQQNKTNRYPSLSFVALNSVSAFQTYCYNIMGKTASILLGFDNKDRLNIVRTSSFSSINKKQQLNFSAVEKYYNDNKKIREVLGKKYTAYTTIDQKIFWTTINNLKKSYDAKQRSSYMIGYSRGQVYYVEERDPFFGIKEVIIFYVSANNKEPLRVYDKILKQSSKAATGGGL